MRLGIVDFTSVVSQPELPSPGCLIIYLGWHLETAKISESDSHWRPLLASNDTPEAPALLVRVAGTDVPKGYCWVRKRGIEENTVGPCMRHPGDAIPDRDETLRAAMGCLTKTKPSRFVSVQLGLCFDLICAMLFCFAERHTNFCSER